MMNKAVLLKANDIINHYFIRNVNDYANLNTALKLLKDYVIYADEESLGFMFFRAIHNINCLLDNNMLEANYYEKSDDFTKINNEVKKMWQSDFEKFKQHNLV